MTLRRSEGPARALIGLLVLIALALLAIPWFLPPPGTLKIVVHDSLFESDLSSLDVSASDSGGWQGLARLTSEAEEGFAAVFERIPAGEPRTYDLTVPGYETLSVTATVPPLGVETVSLPLIPTFGRLEVVAVHAQTGEPLVGLPLQVTVGGIDASGLGAVLFDRLEPGPHEITAAADGLCGYSGSVNVKTRETVRTPVPLAADVRPPERFRFILDWDDLPRDLDAHLVLEQPSVGLVNSHVFFVNKQGRTRGGADWAVLDHDWTRSEGFETTTVFDAVDGLYRYYVHRYSSTGELATSGAQVRLLLPGCQAQGWTVSSRCRGRFWHVADIQTSAGTIDVIPGSDCGNSLVSSATKP